MQSFCDFDMNNAVATMHIHFKTVSELLNMNLSSFEKPVVNEEAIDILKNAVDMVPRKFKVDFIIHIDDYQNYDAESVLTAFQSAMETYKFRNKVKNKTKKSKMSVFLVVGLLILCIYVCDSHYRWFSSAGPVFSVIIAFLIELMFEVYFEDGSVYFTVNQIYRRHEGDNRRRFGKIILNRSDRD